MRDVILHAFDWRYNDIADWNDEKQVQDEQLSGLPDITLSIAVVQEQIQCMTVFVNIGCEGFQWTR